MHKFKLSERFKSFKYAFNGIKLCISQEHNAWIHCSASFFVIVLAFFFHVTSIEWCILLLCIGLVISAEIMNTAIEHLVNFISPDYNIKAGLIKDLAAGAVLVCALVSLIVGIVIFMPYIFNHFKF